MDLQDLLNQLRSERTRIDDAIAALEALTDTSPGRTQKDGRRRRMSAAARKRISAAMKRRWAKWKGKSAPKQVKAAAAKPARRPAMSAAAKQRLSDLMKARWAARKTKP